MAAKKVAKKAAKKAVKKVAKKANFDDDEFNQCTD